MKNQIIGKINKEVSKNISTEPQVLYMLAQTRKVLKDYDKSFANYPVLSFFCDWSLHSQMDRSDTKKNA